MLLDPATILWLIWYLDGYGAASNDSCWLFSRQKFCSLLHTSLQAFGLERLGFSPGFFRAGGGTWRLEEGRSISEVKFSGGWSAEKSLSHYLQEAEATLTVLSFDPLPSRRLETCLQLLDILERPPVVL